MNIVEEVDKEINRFIEDIDDKHVRSLFKRVSGGKMLRAKLISTIAGVTKDSIKLAAIIETIHTASLLHDDVIDNSSMRRGVESLNATFGDKQAVIFGDILYSKAFYELNFLDKEISKIVSDAVLGLSIGELYDLILSKKFDSDEETYFFTIYKKTALLIEASSKSSAILSCKDVDKFASYGKYLGIAFQIIDDVLDITQDTKTLGKPSMNDFLEGKTTLPYIYLYQLLDDKDKERLASYHGKKISLNNKNWIKNMMNEKHCVKMSIEKAKEVGEMALDSVRGENNKSLNEIVKSIIYRNF